MNRSGFGCPVVGCGVSGAGIQRSVAALPLFLYNRTMNTNTQSPKKLTRKQISEGLDSFPVSGLLTGNNRELTGKQKAFARAVALGSTGADAYRKTYSDKSSARTAGNNAAKIKAHTGVELEIQAIRRAQEAEHIKNPAALRLLVINTLVELATNPDTKDAVRLQAVKVLGGVTEVAAFTERKETTVITSSTDARAEVMAELRALANAHAMDAHVIDTQAADLLEELKPTAAATHPPPTTTRAEQESPVSIHTIPLEQSQDFSGTLKNYPREDIPTPAFREDPPA